MVSIGSASRGLHDAKPYSVAEAADRALYRAKDKERNRVASER